MVLLAEISVKTMPYLRVLTDPPTPDLDEVLYNGKCVVNGEIHVQTCWQDHYPRGNHPYFFEDSKIMVILHGGEIGEGERKVSGML